MGGRTAGGAQAPRRGTGLGTGEAGARRAGAPGAMREARSPSGCPVSAEAGHGRDEALGARLGRTVAPDVGVNSVPLLPQAKRIQAVRTVDREHAIEVVNLVLDQLGAIALEVFFMPGALDVLVPEADAVGPLDPDQQVRK